MVLREKFEKALCAPLAEAEYLFSRYRQAYCIAAIESSCRVDLDRLRTHLRKTDTAVKVDETHYAIVFKHVEGIGSGYKAAENVLSYLENEYPDMKLHIGVACLERECQQDTLGRALYALSVARYRQQNYVEDDHDID